MAPANADPTAHVFAEPAALYNAAKWLHETGGSPAEAEVIVSRAITAWELVPTRFPGKVWLAFCWCQQAQACSLRGHIRFAAGREQEAESDYQQALALFAKLKPEEIDTLTALPDLARLEQAYGELLWSQGNRKSAADAFRRAEEAWRRIEHPAHHLRDNELAWLLATCPDEHFRKPEEAVALSEKAVTLRPKDGPVWRTRGVALLRAGRHRDAAEALEKGAQLGGGGDALDWFFLAMARWKLDAKKKARELFDRATGWTDKNQPHDPVLRRFRAEAATLLGIQDASAIKSKEVSPQKP
jgi:tetratricopeptide (TPR) repeat protein